jgi:uncharacterized membrane protein YgcG
VRAMIGTGQTRFSISAITSTAPALRGGASIRLLCARVLVALCCATALGACATVAPYERERLAKRDMQLERNPDASAGEEHATAYREGSSGGGSSCGGGCGCN